MEWNDASINPPQPGYYEVKITYNRELGKKIYWNGEDWVLDIGRIVSNEIEAWK